MQAVLDNPAWRDPPECLEESSRDTLENLDSLDEMAYQVIKAVLVCPDLVD